MKKLMLFGLLAYYAATPAHGQNIRPDSTPAPAVETTPIQLNPIQLDRLTALYERSAYAAGRCFIYLSDSVKVDIRRQIGNSQHLMKIYYDAIEESRTRQPTFEQCQKVLTNVETAIKRITG